MVLSDSFPVVLQVAPIGMNLASGLAHSIPCMVEALYRLGVPVGLLTTSGDGPYKIAQPYPVVYFRDLSRLSLTSLPDPLNYPDLVVFHSTYILAHARLAHEVYRMGIPYVVTPRGGMTRGAQQIKRLKKIIGNLLFFNRMVRRAVAIHCLTEHEAADVRLWDFPVFTVGNGVTLPSVDSLAQPGQGVGFQLVFVGRLDLYHKGLDVLVTACSLIRDELRQAKAQVHLYGPDVRNCKTVIDRMIIANDLQDLVQIHAPVYGAEKAKMLRNADLFLHTSRFEGHPMAVLEALSYGVPCLLTPGTNMATEVFMHGAGWRVDPHPEAIAEGICSALSERSDLAVRGRAGRDLAEKKYSWHQVGLQLLNKYNEILCDACCNR